MSRDRITLFISRVSARRAADTFSRQITPRPAPDQFRIIPATLRDDDTGHIERGFRVVLLNASGHPVGNL